MSVPTCEVCGESESSKYCVSCENKLQCEDCCTFLHSKKNRKDHVIISYEEWKEQEESKSQKVDEIPKEGVNEATETITSRMCQIHPKDELKLYCSQCRKLVCLQCITDKHQGHPCTQLVQAVPPFVEELEEKLEKFNDYIEKYETAHSVVNKATEKIEKESSDLQENVKQIFETIKTHLETKEKEIIDSIVNRTTPRIKLLKQQSVQLENEIGSLSEQTRMTKEITQSTEDNYQFIVNSLVRSAELEDYEFVEIRETPYCHTGDIQHLDFSNMKDSIENIKLSPPIDFSQTHLKPRSMYASDSQDNKFTILLKNWDKFPGTLDPLEPLKVTVVGAPEGAEKTEIVLSETNAEGEFSFIFRAKTTGEYKIKIHWRNYEISGSPYNVSIRSNLSQPIELPSYPYSSAHFFLPNEEFWFASKKSVTVYDTKGKKLKSHTLPTKAAYISSDKFGNIYISDGDKTFSKYDKDMNSLKQWKISLAKGESVCAITPSGNQEYCFGMLSNGNILKLFVNNTEKETDLLLSMKGLTSNTGDLIFFDNLFIISDKTVKVFDVKGTLRQQFTEFMDGVTFAVVYDELYACANDSKTWNTLFLAPDWEKKDPLNISMSSISLDSNAKFKQSFMKSPRKQVKSIQLGETVSKIKLQGKLPSIGTKSLSITPLGDFIVVAVKNEEFEGIEVWEYATGKKINSIKHPAAHVATNGIEIISTGPDNKIHIWNFDDGEEKLSFDVGDDVKCFTPTVTLKKMICGHSNGKLNSYDIKNPETAKNMGKHGDCIHAVFASKDGRFILSGSSDGTIKVWGNDGTDLQTLKGHTGPVTSVTMTDDGKFIVSGGADRSIRIWSSESYKNTKTFKGVHKDSITSLSVTPNGQYVLSCCSVSSNVKMHKMDSGNEKVNISVGKKEKNICLAVDPAGGYFTTGTDNFICVFQNVKYLVDTPVPAVSKLEKKESVPKVGDVEPKIDDVKPEEKESIENWLNE